MEWDYSGRQRGRDGQKKKIGKVNEKSKRGKVKKGCPGPRKAYSEKDQGTIRS